MPYIEIDWLGCKRQKIRRISALLDLLAPTGGHNMAGLSLVKFAAIKTKGYPSIVMEIGMRRANM